MGNGGAALCAARAARISGYGGEVRLVSDTGPPAFNPMLAPYYLRGHIPWERCFPFEPDFYRNNGITCSCGSPVEHLDALNQEVITADGSRITYDRCLIATGASAVVPPIPGLEDSRRAFVLRTAESTRRLERAMGSSKRAVVLGASLVGLKMAEILRERRKEVILLDVVDQILPGGAHPLAAALLKAYFEDKGVDVRLDCTMEGMEGAREGVVCRFTHGSIEEADFVVVCTGVRPNLAFLDPVQVDIDRALLVDERMRTSVQNLYAAGDVSQGMNALSGKKEWFGTWRNACSQGRTAGHNMAGGDEAHAGSVQENIRAFFGWTYAQIGDVKAEGRPVRRVVFGDPREKGYGLLAFEGDVLLGANLINCTRFAGVLRRAIVTRMPWSGHLESRRENLATDRFEASLRSITAVEMYGRTCVSTLRR